MTKSKKSFGFVGRKHKQISVSRSAVEKQIKKFLVSVAGKKHPEMLVQSVAVINAMVIFIRSGNDDASRQNGIYTVFDNKRNVAAEVYVYLTFLVDMSFKNVFGAVMIEFNIFCHKVELTKS